MGMSVMGVARENRQFMGIALALAGVEPAFACWVLSGARGHLSFKGSRSLRAAQPDLFLACASARAEAMRSTHSSITRLPAFHRHRSGKGEGAVLLACCWCASGAADGETGRCTSVMRLCFLLRILRRGALALSCRAWLIGQALRMQRHFKLGLMDPVFRETIVRPVSHHHYLSPPSATHLCPP